jgi:hypothetical protein
VRADLSARAAQIKDPAADFTYLLTWLGYNPSIPQAQRKEAGELSPVQLLQLIFTSALYQSGHTLLITYSLCYKHKPSVLYRASTC